MTLGDDAKPMLAADRLTARLRFFPLFAGRVQIADVSLVRPRINVSFDRDGHSNWASSIDALARALGPKANRPADATSFTEIRINDGTIALQDATRGINETFKKVELALAWPFISKSFAATGRVVWHDEPIDTSITLTDFASALAGDRSGMKIRLAGAPAQICLRRQLEHAADAADRRHACGRRAIAARNVALDRPQAALRGADLAASRSRPRPTFGRNDRALHGQCRTGRQCRRRRPRLRHRRPADPARHARRGELDLRPMSTIRLLTSNERDWNRVPLVSTV